MNNAKLKVAQKLGFIEALKYFKINYFNNNALLVVDSTFINGFFTFLKEKYELVYNSSIEFINFDDTYDAFNQSDMKELKFKLSMARASSSAMIVITNDANMQKQIITEYAWLLKAIVKEDCDYYQLNCSLRHFMRFYEIDSIGIF